MGEANKNYEKFYSKDTYAAVGALINKVEQRRHFKALFGRVSGSKTQGLFSKKSDNDFLIFVEGSEENPEQKIGVLYENAYIGNELVEFEIVYIYWDTALERVLERKQMVFEGYPTNYYRSKEEKLKYLPQNMPQSTLLRYEYPFLMFHQLLLGDSLWVSDVYMEHSFIEQWSLERTIDALDTFYVRAHGNYVHFIENQNRILLRKYLYALSQIWAIEWLLSKRTKPPIMFADLMAGTEIESHIRQSVDELITLNREETLNKAKVFTESRPELTEYIAAMLYRQKKRIALYPRDETLEDIILRTPLGLRPKLYFSKYGDWKPLE